MIECIKKPDKDFWKEISSNAKFESLQQVLNVKVGINNFATFSFKVTSSLLTRDILLNSRYVSAWARSTQVLNETDSKYSVYKNAISEDNTLNDELISEMEALYKKGYSQDNIRTLVPLNSVTDYAFTCDIMTLVYLYFSLQRFINSPEISKLIFYFERLLTEEYGIDLPALYPAYKSGIDSQFQNSGISSSLEKITGQSNYYANVTYSVVGQIMRHRNLYKTIIMGKWFESMTSLLDRVKELTYHTNFKLMDIPDEIAGKIIDYTDKATSLDQLVQGSIFPLAINGMNGDLLKMLSQRSCFINDSAQFLQMFKDFEINSINMKGPNKIIPPCKNNVATNGCYVEYVNKSRLRGEELTQVACPIWTANQVKKGELDNETHLKSLNAPKSKWYYENLDSWEHWKNLQDGQNEST